MLFPCEIHERPAQPTAMVRRVCAVQDLPSVLGPALGMVANRIIGSGEPMGGPPYVAYHNMDMQALEMEIGFTLSRELEGQGEVQPGEIPAGPQASVLYKGPYPGVAEGYNALTAFMQEQGREPTGVAYELYLNDPANTAPDELLTQIVFPLKPVPQPA